MARLNYKNIYSQKAQIGEGLAWIIAICVILFIMVLFLGVTALLAPSAYLDASQINLKYNREVIQNKPIFVGDFFNSNKKDVFAWADSDLVVSREEFVGKNIPEDKSKLYQSVYTSYVNTIKTGDYLKLYKEPYFYIRTIDKEMRIEGHIPETIGPINSGGWGMSNPPNGQFLHGFQQDEISGDGLGRYFFVSDNGTLIMIIFYDKSVGQNG